MKKFIYKLIYEKLNEKCIYFDLVSYEAGKPDTIWVEHFSESIF